MQKTGLKCELSKARWGMDLAVSLAAATGFYLWIVWFTRMFETNPFEPRRLLRFVAIIASGYIVSMLLGRMVLRTNRPSLLWVAGVGSAAVSITRVLLSLPGEIDYHGRFHSDKSLVPYLIGTSAPGFFWTFFALVVVTLVAA